MGVKRVMSVCAAVLIFPCTAFSGEKPDVCLRISSAIAAAKIIRGCGRFDVPNVDEPKPVQSGAVARACRFACENKTNFPLPLVVGIRSFASEAHAIKDFSGAERYFTAKGAIVGGPQSISGHPYFLLEKTRTFVLLDKARSLHVTLPWQQEGAIVGGIEKTLRRALEATVESLP